MPCHTSLTSQIQIPRTHMKTTWSKHVFVICLYYILYIKSPNMSREVEAGEPPIPHTKSHEPAILEYTEQ